MYLVVRKEARLTQDRTGRTDITPERQAAQERNRSYVSPQPDSPGPQPMCHMHLLHLFVAAQLAAPLQRQAVITLPETGVDDPAVYQGYQTRFYHDAAGNTLQIYMEGSAARIVHLLANADNESVGFSVRAAGGSPRLTWGAAKAQVSATRGFRSLTHTIVSHAPHVHVGWFLLGSMRVERDFQYWKKHLQPFASPRFILDEHSALIRAIDRLPPAARSRHLAAMNAPDLATLRRRVHPRLATFSRAGHWVGRATQLSLDGRDSLAVEISVDPARVAATRSGDSLSLRALAGDSVVFTVRVATSANALAPLTREEIFTPEFLAFVAREGGTSPLLERQVRGVELLSSRDKLMAGLPAYATYFGRDMLVSALMMRPIWRGEMTEFAIASVLRKLSPSGQVSHEEALGGQAVREAASEYASLVDRALATGTGAAARDSLLARAHRVLREQRRVRENYHMVDDEFQFPVLVAQWISDSTLATSHKTRFLTGRDGSAPPRLELLLRELALVARMTSAYAAEPVATNLVAFAPRDGTRWSSSSWRDSGAGYANGRFAMDVNAIWAPHALESMAVILAALPSLGFSTDSLRRVVPELATGTPLGRYLDDPLTLRRATDTWWQAVRHFVVTLSPGDVSRMVDARIAALPAREQDYWRDVLTRTGASRDSLTFLALSLDSSGRPIGVANTDVATRLFLGDRPGTTLDTTALLRDVRIFTRAYPVGLLIDGVGPVVANDAYAPPAVWADFERDRYHGPRVVWGREVNLFALGVARHLARHPGAAHAAELRQALDRVMRAAEASGFQSELWSYEVGDRVVPVRYGTGSDVQLWSTTDLAVQFALSRLRP